MRRTGPSLSGIPVFCMIWCLKPYSGAGFRPFLFRQMGCVEKERRKRFRHRMTFIPSRSKPPTLYSDEGQESLLVQHKNPGFFDDNIWRKVIHIDFSLFRILEQIIFFYSQFIFSYSKVFFMFVVKIGPDFLSSFVIIIDHLIWEKRWFGELRLFIILLENLPGDSEEIFFIRKRLFVLNPYGQSVSEVPEKIVGHFCLDSRPIFFGFIRPFRIKDAVDHQKVNPTCYLGFHGESVGVGCSNQARMDPFQIVGQVLCNTFTALSSKEGFG